MTPDDKEMHEQILELRQEFDATKRPAPVQLSDALVRALELREEKGLTWRQIADILNNEGFRTEKNCLWSAPNVYNHLTGKGIYIEPRERKWFRQGALTQKRDNHGRWIKE